MQFLERLHVKMFGGGEARSNLGLLSGSRAKSNLCRYDRLNERRIILPGTSCSIHMLLPQGPTEGVRGEVKRARVTLWARIGSAPPLLLTTLASLNR